MRPSRFDNRWHNNASSINESRVTSLSSLASVNKCGLYRLIWLVLETVGAFCSNKTSTRNFGFVVPASLGQ